MPTPDQLRALGLGGFADLIETIMDPLGQLDRRLDDLGVPGPRITETLRASRPSSGTSSGASSMNGRGGPGHTIIVEQGGDQWMEDDEGNEWRTPAQAGRCDECGEHHHVRIRGHNFHRCPDCHELEEFCSCD